MDLFLMTAIGQDLAFRNFGIPDQILKKSLGLLTSQIGSLGMGSARNREECGRRRERRGQLSIKQSLCEAVIQIVKQRLIAVGHGLTVCEDLESHFASLPARYTLNVDPTRHEDVLLHMRLLREARDGHAMYSDHSASHSSHSSHSSQSPPLPHIHVRRVLLQGTHPPSSSGREGRAVGRTEGREGREGTGDRGGCRGDRGDRGDRMWESSEGEEDLMEERSHRGIPIASSPSSSSSSRLPKPTFGSNLNLAVMGGSGSPSSFLRSFQRMAGTSPGSITPPSKGTPSGTFSRGTPPRCTPTTRFTLASSTNSLSEMDEDSAGESSPRKNGRGMLSHPPPALGWEVTVASEDRHGLLKYLTAALVGVGPAINIREAHIFSTTDGMALEVFVLDGWQGEDPEELRQSVLESVHRQLHAGHLAPLLSEEDKMAELRRRVEAIQYEDWALDFADLHLGERLGSGSSGRLYRGVYKGQEVAVKVIKVTGGNVAEDSGSVRAQPAAELLQLFKQEVAIMRIVRHKNLVQFIGACSHWPRLFVVTELMAGGSVRDVLQVQGAGLAVPDAVKILRDAARGLDFLHKRRVVHRDVKAANLLIDEHNVVKVCDFGVARMLPSALSSHPGEGAPPDDGAGQSGDGGMEEMTAETGTYRWMAPEVLEHKPYNQKADVYSFGIMAWEVLTGEIPYAGMTPLQAAIGVVQRGLRPEMPFFSPPKLTALAEKCWHQDPNQRPDFSEVVSTLEEMIQPQGSWQKAIFGIRKR